MKTVSYFLLVAVLFVGVQETAAQRTIRMNLESIIANAGIIVHGTVASAARETDPATQLPVVKVTIDVIENFYGAHSKSLTVVMLAGAARNGERRLTEMPRYTAGEEIVVMLHAPGSLGLTSPVGMGQGSFTIRGKNGRKMVSNTMKNSHLFTGIRNKSLLKQPSWSTSEPGDISLSDFAATVRSLVTTLK